MTVTYFPLRSNAQGLVAGAPAQAVMRRVKTAALLGEVIVEDGEYRLSAGPGGASAWIGDPGANEMTRWQSARDRGAAQAGGFTVSMAGEGAPEATRILSSEATVSWRASFAPLKRELPLAYDWMHFTSIGLDRQGKRLAEAWRKDDEQHGVFADEPERFLRMRLLTHVGTDTVTAMGFGAAVSVDSRHRAAFASRIARHQAESVVSADALTVLVPDVGGLGWSEIDGLRRERGWEDLRALWAEIGAVAAEASTASTAAQIVREAYDDRLREAAAAAEGPRGYDRWAGTLLGLVCGVVPTVAGAPVVPALIAGAAATGIGVLADEALRRTATPTRWVAADQALHDAARRVAVRL